jgi:hypothetical protein
MIHDIYAVHFTVLSFDICIMYLHLGSFLCLWTWFLMIDLFALIVGK